MKLAIDNWRWAGVPFILTAGKALQEKKVEVRIVFREAPCQVPELRGACRNELVVRVQPDERVYWRVANKVPGLEELQVEPRRMNLMYTHTQQWLNLQSRHWSRWGHTTKRCWMGGSGRFGT